MGIQDRDYWRERYNKKTGYVETSGLRKSANEPHAISQDQLDAIWKPAPRRSGWWLFLWLFLSSCFLFYGIGRVIKALLT